MLSFIFLLILTDILVKANCVRMRDRGGLVKPKSQVSAVTSKAKAQKVPLRWSGHLPLAIRIALCGSDEGGKTFSESTQTVGVDRRGARIVTAHQIALGAEVTVENSAVHRTARAKVVWRGEGTSAQKSEVVVELLDPTESAGIWGIKFPSQNNKTVPTVSPSTKVSDLAVSDEQAATGPPGTSAVPPDPRMGSLVEGGGLDAELEGLTPSLEEDTKRSLDALAAESVGKAIAAWQDYTETLRRSAEEAMSSVSLAAEKAVAELRVAQQETEANFKSGVGDYDRQLAELSASGIENFQRKIQTALDKLQEQGKTGLAHAVQEIVERGRQGFTDQLQQQAQDLWKSFSDELKTSVAPLVDEAESRIAGATQSSIDRLGQGAQAVIEECRLQTGRHCEEQAAAVVRNAEAGAKSVQEALDEGLAKLAAVRVQMETAIGANTDSFRQRLSTLAASEIEAVERQADALLQSFESRLLHNTLQEFQQKVAEQVAGQIPNITQELLERSALGLQKQAADSVERLSQELKASRVALLDETRQQIDALIQASLASLGSQVQAVDEESRRQLTQTASQCARAARESAQLATDEALAGLQAAQGEMQSTLLASFKDQLQSTLNDFRERSTTDLTGELQGLAERLERSCTEQLQRHAEDGLRASNEQLRDSRMALVDEAREQITTLVKSSLESLGQEVQGIDEQTRHQLSQTASQCADAALESIRLAKDEAATSLQAAQGKVLASAEAHAEEYQKRLAELSMSGFEELGRKAGGLLESFRGHLQSTLSDFQQRSTTELNRQLQELAERFERGAAEQLQRDAEKALTDSKEELQASSCSLVSATREQIAGEVRASFESLSRRVQTTEQECRTKLDQAASECVQAALGSVARAADEGMAGLQAAHTKVQAGLDSQTEECEKRLAKLSTSVIQEFGLMARMRLESFKGELQSTLDDFHDQGITELTDRLQKSAEGLEQHCAEALRRQSDDTLKSLSGELETSGTRLVYEARLRLAETARESAESFNQELRATIERSRDELAQTASQSAREATDSISLAGEQAVARLEAAQEATKASFTADAQREAKALAELSTTSKEELQRTADSVLFGFGHSLKQKAGVTSEEAGHQLRGMLEELATSSLRESHAKHEELVKKQRRIFEDNVDLATQATLERFTRRLAGLEQEHERGSVTAKLVWVLVAVAPTILFVYLATRPVMQLRVDPPAEFLSAVNEAAPERRAIEERVARAYWDWAYLHLQHKYPFAAQLPEDPPMEMEVYGNDFHYAKTNKREEHSDPADLEAEVARRRYWQKLRQVWATPQAWEKSSLWDHK